MTFFEVHLSEILLCCWFPSNSFQLLYKLMVFEGQSLVMYLLWFYKCCTKPHLFPSFWLWWAGGWKPSCSEAFQYPISLQTHIKFAILFEVSRKTVTAINWISGSVFLTTLLLVLYSSPCGHWDWKVAQAVSQRLGMLRAPITHPLTSLPSPSPVLINLF